MPITFYAIKGRARSETLDLVRLRGAWAAGNLNALGGNDTVAGGGYADTLIGGSGNDLLNGRAGADDLRGGEGADRFQVHFGLPGRDRIEGGTGRDTLVLRLSEAQAADAAIQAEIAAAMAALAAQPGARLVALGVDMRDVEAIEVVVAPPVRPVDLGRIDDGGRGIRLIGQTDGDEAGCALAALGDINGDGFGDVLVGAALSDAAGTDSGAAYVVYGTAATTPIDLDAIAAGVGGYRLEGQSAGDRAGSAVASAGDVNGDGIGDLIIGAPRDTRSGVPQVGGAYVVFGGGGATDLAAVARGIGGFRIFGAAEDEFAGYAVATAGDLNGDGRADLLVSVPNDSRFLSTQGAVYAVFGKADGATVQLGAMAGATGFAIYGEAKGDQAGIAAAGGSDINGDGFDDLVVGAWLNDGPGGDDSGAAYVVWGSPTLRRVDLVDVARGVGGFKLTGEAPGDQAGFSVAIAGDVNGDGLADVLVGARGNDSENNFDNGAAYVVFGKADNEAVALDDVGRQNRGFEIRGEASADQLGFSVAAAGDVNGDGLADLLLGASLNDSAGSVQNGAAYVVYGKTDNSTVALDDVLNGIGGFKVRGDEDFDFAGRTVAAAGDVNNDGFADLLIGASGNDAGGVDAGGAYILFGNSTWLA